MNQTINIFYTKFSKELPKKIYDNYLEKLPFQLKEKNKKFIRWQDRHAHLFGKILLIEALMYYGYPPDSLEKLQYNASDRPYLNEEIDFNISHSGAFVICAIASNVKLGIDIEKIQKIDFLDFEKVMTGEQWEDIKNSINPISSFYKYWTIKESVIKADSRGLSIPLLDIHVKENIVKLDNHTWYLKELNFNKNYLAYLASNKNDFTVNVIEKNYYRNLLRP